MPQIDANGIKLAYEEDEPPRAVVLQRLGLPDERIVEVAWSDLDREVDAPAADDGQRPGVPHVSASSKRARTAGGTSKHRQGGPAILGAPAQANGAAEQAGADQQPLAAADGSHGVEGG